MSNYDCDLCLKKQYGCINGSYTVRHNYFLKILVMAAKICFISYSSMKIFNDIFFNFKKYFLSEKIYYAPFPNNVYLYKRLNNCNRELTFPVRYLILGNFFSHKGASYFFNAMLICPKIKAEFHFYGQIDKSIQNSLNGLSSKSGMFHFHGMYRPGDLDLSNFHFSLHLSIWPETYCQTLSEAWAARVIPIVTDIGALDDRVIDGVNGLKVDYTKPSSLVECLVKINDGIVDFTKIQSQINDDLFINQKKHADNYKVLFDQIIDHTSAKSDKTTCKNSRILGFSLNSLGAPLRSNYWNKNFFANFNKESIYPSKSYFSSIRPWCHELIPSKGAIDKCGGDLIRDLPSDFVYSLKNDEKLNIMGWCEHPIDNFRYIPVALLKNNDKYYYVELSLDTRPDLVKLFGGDFASSFGIKGFIQLLNPSMLLMGITSISLGWLCNEKLSLYYKDYFVNTEVKLYA